MANEAQYSGLAAGLNTLANAFTNRAKAQLEEQQEMRREESAEARRIAAEERADRRARAKPDPDSTTYVERDGALFKQQRNAYGDILDESLASADDIDRRNYTKQKQELDLQTKGLAAQLSQAKLDAAPKTAALEQALKQAQIDTTRARGQAALINANRPRTGSGSSSSASEGSVSEYAALLKKQAKDVLDQYAENDDTLTATEINRITRQAVEEAATYGLDPQELLEQILEERQFGRPINN